MKQGLILLVMLLAGGAFAADTPASADQAAMMAAWQKYSTPGPAQKALSDMVGNWKYTSKFWQTPGAKPETSEGTATTKWALGDRFVQTEVTGTAMGQQFMGVGYTGYDNLKKVYQGVWMDNMSTGMIVTMGTMDKSKKTFTENGTMPDPMTGALDKAFRNETKFKGKDKYTFSMFTKGADGKEFKSMEMEYTRVK